MLLNSPDVVRSRVEGLRARVQELLAARESAVARFLADREAAEAALRTATASAAAELDAGRRKLADAAKTERDRIEARHAHNLERIEGAFARAAGRTDETLARARERLRAEREKAQAAVPRGSEAAAAALADVRALREETRAVQEKIADFARSVRVALPDPEKVRPPAGIAGPKAAETARERLAETSARLAARRRSMALPFARTKGQIFMALGVIVVHAAAAAAIVQFKPQDNQQLLQTAVVSLVGFLIASTLFGQVMKHGVAGSIESLWASAAETDALLRHREDALLDAMQRQQEKSESARAKALADAEAKLGGREQEAAQVHSTRTGILADQKAQAIRRSEGHRDAAFARQEDAMKRDTQRLADWHARAMARHQAVRDERMKEIAAREQKEIGELSGRWSAEVGEFHRAASQACVDSRRAHPAWADPSWQKPSMPASFPEGIRLGELTFDLKTILHPPEDARFPLPGDGTAALPLDMAFPGVGRVVFNAGPDTRARALAALQGTILRILCSLPPGKAKFTLIDPVGLGQSFSALMHLADFDESLVGSRIWTETAHVEKRLSELTEHIEKVIQKYLRNRYKTIDEYNREVGPMAEAYRFLVVADFPTGFSELALERLASIARSGARCGVVLLILRDSTQKLPPAADRATLESGGLTIEAGESGLVVREPGASEGRLQVEPPPAAEALNSLLQAVGRRCAEAKRVEIPFDLIAPKPDDVWSLSSQDGIRIALGRGGADRLQFLDVGRSTAQHALIAGRTGSGKSTLFHVIVTNAALWYSPREVELYLIDFKKGVEFKTYANNALPQARVIAIESDREFGVSVLRRVYAELGKRAEKFRAAGVQDFAGYRKAAPADPIPRTMLLIDEFQEFFTEEDAIAQEAALLLDRIVRQGRAFGVHVILGSQTLGGSYTLAKSTIGQMAVRIALPCSEADSYLILSDDNAAARLLSRPGEAIYNDKSGAIEGNDPFQVSWLSDEIRDAKLRLVRDRAAREGIVSPEPTTVFEGNVPADLRNNRLLSERLARAGTGDPCAWIGEANAIKGPTEIRFRPQRGSNVLIVGQQRESALSILCSSLVSLAGAHAPQGARFIILDGSPPDLGHGRHFAALAEALPQRLEIVDFARVPALMEELDAEVAARLESGKQADPRIFIGIHDLQTFRKLRQSDDLDFGGGEEKKKSPDRCFANVLSEGPALGIHTIAWCDSLNNVNRMLSRKLLKEFDIRVLFQMSATDSSELIDSPAAGKLGLYRGLLFLEEEGTVEKFRPYGLPELDTIATFGRLMKQASGTK